MNIKRINKTVKTDIKEGLKAIYPEVFEDNKINFEKLKALLSGEVIEKEDDRFYFNWAGKSGLYKIIQSPAYGTLKPDKKKSVDFDNTENIVIAGENLETLKLLLKPYFGKVKMIYIDPPYNTGKDFIYRDNFKQPLKDYLEKTGQIDSEGKKLTTNTETSGRYHSDWLNFIYPRLFLARSLLRDDGVIFISIDDHEVHHLRMIMDEIFGEENFCGCFVINSTPNARDYGHIAKMHEYVLFYAKNIFEATTELLPEREKQFKYSDDKGKFNIHPLYNSNVAFTPANRPNLYYPFYLYPDSMIDDNFYEIGLVNKEGAIKIYPPESQKKDAQFVWRWGKEKAIKELNKDIVGHKTESGEYRIVQKMRHSSKLIRSLQLEKIVTSRKGTAEVEELFGKKIYLFPKPKGLIKKFIQAGTNKNDVALDFFAGSGTTGHAVWDLNKEDGGNRKFILVQLDEEVQDENIKKEFPTIADICIERLRRVSEKYKKENEGQLIKDNQDFGFKVFKLDKSNFNLKEEFEFDPSEDKEELKKRYLEWLGLWVNEPLAPSWKEIDVIYEVMLKEGLNLNSQTKRVKIKENNFYHVIDTEQDLEFYISLEDKIENEAIEEIRTSKYKGKIFVFIDSALTDNDKINLSAFVRLKVI